jgi:hypothetical protein
MAYEWDNNKAKSNLQKHGIDFADVISVFTDDASVTIMDDGSDEEQFVTIGMDAFGRILVVVYTWREENIRIISARKATRHERRQYKG